MSQLQETVAATADRADLHAPVPTLLVELQTLLGSLAATVTDATDRGRRPFRPGQDWTTRLGELAYGLFLVADQSGVDLEAAVMRTAQHVGEQGERAQAAAAADWPFGPPQQ